MYFNKNVIYIDLKDIFNKLIKYELEDEIDDLNIKEEDINIILNNLFYALKDALKEGSYLSKTEKDINEYTLVINNENKNMKYNKFVDYLLNSNEFIDTLSSISESSKEEIINSLKDSKEEKDDLEETIYISIYTKVLTNDFVKLEVGTEKDVYVTFAKIDDKTYKLETTGIENSKSVVTITNDNNKTTLVYDINNENLKAKVVFNISYTYNQNINMPLTKESILISELTEEDTNKMLENLMNNENINDIIETLKKLMPESNYEDDFKEDNDEENLGPYLRRTLMQTASEVDKLYANKPFAISGECNKEWGGLSNIEYKTCTYEFDEFGEVTITIEGKGKFSDFKYCYGTSVGASCME